MTARRDRRAPALWTAVALTAVVLMCTAGAVAWQHRNPGHRAADAAGALPGAPVVSHSPAGQPSASARSRAPVPTSTRPGSTASAPSVAPGSPGSPVPTSSGGSKAPVGPGSYHVGIDIFPGTWSSGGLLNIDLNVCTYRINGGPVVNITISVGATSVRLSVGDTFTTSNCQAWHWSP